MNKKIENQSALMHYYSRALKEKQEHFRNQWFKVFGLSRNQFYERLKKPKISDLALWQSACDELIFSDRVMKIYEPFFKDVEIFALPEHFNN